MWKTEPPEEINRIIKSYTKAKLPHFFIYAKDKDLSQVEPENDSVMNRISNHIPDVRVKYSKSIRKFDWRVLVNQDIDYTVSENSEIIKAYNFWKKKQFRFDSGEDTHIKDEDLYKFRCIRQDIIGKSGTSIDYIVNSLVAYAYTVKKTNDKTMLWACFGEEILANIKNNVTGKICPICGRRFEPSIHNQICCSEECSHAMDIQKKRENRETVKQIFPELVAPQ